MLEEMWDVWRNYGKFRFNCSGKLEVTGGSGRENYYVNPCFLVSIHHAFSLEGKQEQRCKQKELHATHLTAEAERVEKVRRERERSVRLMWGWRKAKTERRIGWVREAVTWVQVAGEWEKVWIHGILDVLTWPVEGVRIDWPQRTNWESTIKREGEMRWWRFSEKDGSKENINGLTEARMDFSSVSSEPNFTAVQGWIELERKSACWSSPEKSTLMHEKLLWLLTLFLCSLFNRMHLCFSCLSVDKSSH